MKRLLSNALLILVTLALAGYGWIWLENTRPPGAERTVAPERALAVSVRELQPRTVTLEVEAYGVLEAIRTARLAVEVGGRVAEVMEPWLPGTYVEEGDVLMRLDTGLFDQEVGVAEAAVVEVERALDSQGVKERGAASAAELALESFELAQAEEGRILSLFAAGDAAASERDRARGVRLDAARALDLAQTALARAGAGRAALEATLERTKASASLARERRDRSVLKAPFDGHLVSRGPAIGTHLSTGAQVGELHDLESLDIRVAVPEERLGGLAGGGEASVRLSAEPSRARQGIVRSVGVQADAATRSVPVVVSLEGGPRDSGEEEGPPLAAGQFAKVVLRAGQVDRALVIGRGEFVWKDGKAVVHVLEGAPGEAPVARRRELQLGAPVDGGWLVEAGLGAGETLITGPHGLVTDGGPCRLVGGAVEAP
jgi:RND family efflux transporter MFP subunit